MVNVLMTVFVIFGAIFGAGFASGNEIVVFFSRFGVLSYFYILIACGMIFFVINFFLVHGQGVAKQIENSKWLNVIVMFISIIFCASMYAGIDGLLAYMPSFWHYALLLVVIFFCVFVTMKGVDGLGTINLYLMPFLSVIFMSILFASLTQDSGFVIDNSNSFFGILYAPLYVALNTCTSIVVLAKMGEKLTKKQAFLSSLLSTIILFVFLILCNFVLQKNANCFVSEMPILFIVRKNNMLFFLEYFVILFGCFTTLISLCFTLNNSCKKIIKNNYFCIFLSVFLPYFIGNVGFSKIISLFYPLCSVFGVFILLFSIFSLKQTDKIIHPESKQTKHCS